MKGAGLERRSPFALRHTFASLAIAAGVPRFMGTSVEQIGRATATSCRTRSSGRERRSTPSLRRSHPPGGGSNRRASKTLSSMSLRWPSLRYSCSFGSLVGPGPAGLSPRPRSRSSHFCRTFITVGAPRFELGTSSPPDWRANQAAPRPVRPIVAERVTKPNLGDPAHQGGTVLQRETRLTAVASNHFWPSKLARNERRRRRDSRAVAAAASARQPPHR